MILTYRYRLLPSKRQHVVLSDICESQRQLYNAALQERVDCYRKSGKGLTFFDQTKSLTVCRRDLPEMAALSVALQRWTLKRLDDAYVGFFRRIKNNSNRTGFPRFRGKGRWRSFGFSENSGFNFDGKRLRFKGTSTGIRVHVHRRLPNDANIKSCILRRDGQGWVVCFAINISAPEKRDVIKAIGIDLGLKTFAYCSDGVIIPNPRIARKAEKEMRRRQRALSRCRIGSKRSLKVKRQLINLHRNIVNARTTWLHQQSASTVRRADMIVVESLSINGMVRNLSLARSIYDASWAKFLAFLAYKAEKAGVHFVRISPRNTSQRCSGCSEMVPKVLSMRVHSCPHCGLVIDRDLNAARNILRAGASPGVLNVVREDDMNSEIHAIPIGSMEAPLTREVLRSIPVTKD